jgi:hypothetical protein
MNNSIHQPITCRICQKEFENSVAYKKHIEQEHSLEWLSYLREHHSELGGYCLECGKETSFRSFNTGFKRFCSNKCGKNSSITKNKTKTTKLEKYGDAGYTNKEKAVATKVERYGSTSYNNRVKAKETCLEKYGCENPFQNEEIKEKIKSKHLENFGIEYPSQSKTVQEKIITTYQERYGVNWICSSVAIQEKSTQTKLERYGSENYNNREQAKETCLEKYGCENPQQNTKIRNKTKYTNLKNYGEEYPSQSKQVKEKFKRTSRIKYFNSLMKLLAMRNITYEGTEEDYIENEEHVFNCPIHGNFKTKETSNQKINCPHCYTGYNGVSNSEKQIAEFLSQYINLETSNRTVLSGKELDIYIPEKKLAIEFDGLYWHSNLFKDKNYHLQKTLECQEKGIQLLHIFESEWLNKRPVVESVLLAKLGIFQKRLYGRKCEVKIVSQETYREFTELNHLQGYVRASLVLGLFHEDELVEICSFGKSRFKKNEMELLRHCSLLNTQIVGGFSKLIKQWKVLNNNVTLSTYCDLRYSTGMSYLASGWQHIGTSAPNYFYISGTHLENRIKYQKHKLSKQLDQFDISLTEQENMSINGFTWIYDCGNLKFKI